MLRAVLGSHSLVHAPHEITLTGISVAAPPTTATLGMRALGWKPPDLESLLWDRLLHAELQRSGKQVLVHKSPLDVLHWQRMADCWPDARWVFLLRHPAAIAASWSRATHLPPAAGAERLARFMRAVTAARAALPGTTVRYEELTADPQDQVRRLCAELGLPYEPSMLEYGDNHPQRWRRGLGDWSEKIHSGRVLPGRVIADLGLPLVDELAAEWGYPRQMRSTHSVAISDTTAGNVARMPSTEDGAKSGLSPSGQS